MSEKQRVKLIKLSGFIVDPTRNIIVSKSEEIPVQAKVMEVLLVLLENPTETVSKEAFIERVWGGNVYVGKQGITRSISMLRSVFNDSTDTPKFIETIPRRGYRLIVKPSTVEHEAISPRLKRMIFSVLAVISVSIFVARLFFFHEDSNANRAISVTFVSMLPGSETVPSISPLGGLAFNHDAYGTHTAIVTKNRASKSDSKKLLKGRNPFYPLWSPTGKRLAVSTQEENCKIRVFDEGLALIDTFYCALNKQHVLTWASETVLIYINTEGRFSAFDTEKRTTATGNSDVIRTLNFLPTHATYLAGNQIDGGLALFLPVDMQNHRLMVISKDGKTRSGPELYQAAKGLTWLDNDSILISSRIRGRFELSKINLKNWERTPFPLSGDFEMRYPASCNQCNHLTLERFSLGSRLTKLNVDNFEISNVTTMLGSRYERFPAQHDKAGLLFVMNDGQSDALYVTSPGSKESAKLSLNKNLRIIYPSWSNSGDMIAFLGGDDTGTNVYSFSLQTSKLIKHTVSGTFGPPKFSFDDRRIYSGKINGEGKWYIHAIDHKLNTMEPLPISATMAVPVSDSQFLTVTLGQPDIFLTEKSGVTRKLVSLPSELLGAWLYKDGFITHLENEIDWYLVQTPLNGGRIQRYKLPELSLLDLQTITFDGQSLTYVERITENSEVIVVSIQ